MFDLLHDLPPAGPEGEEVEEGLVQDAAVLDDLGHAVGEGEVVQGVQGVGVHEDRLGLPEGPGQVLAVLEVDGHLAAHGGVHLGEEGGGDLDKVHPPEDGGGGEAGQVTHHAAAQGHHGVGAGEPKVHHILPEGAEHGGGLGGLPGGNLPAGGLKAGALQPGDEGGEVDGGHVGVGDHEELFGPGEHRAQVLPGLVEEAGADEDVVAAAGEGYGEGLHGSTSFRVRGSWSCPSWGPGPSPSS